VVEHEPVVAVGALADEVVAGRAQLGEAGVVDDVVVGDFRNGAAFRWWPRRVPGAAFRSAAWRSILRA